MAGTNVFGIRPILNSCDEVFFPAAEGLIGHAIGNHRQASQLKNVLPKLWMVGGSHTQRELFKQMAQSPALQPCVSPRGHSVGLLRKDAAFADQAS